MGNSMSPLDSLGHSGALAGSVQSKMCLEVDNHDTVVEIAGLILEELNFGAVQHNWLGGKH